jgi:hypothetical protein
MTQRHARSANHAHQPYYLNSCLIVVASDLITLFQHNVWRIADGVAEMFGVAKLQREMQYVMSVRESMR